MSFANTVKKLIDEAPVASSGGANVNFGPMVTTPLVIVWKGRGAGNKPDKYTLAEFAKLRGFKSVDDIELEDGKESFQLHFDIDLTELNPSLDFHYERDVAITESRKDPRRPDKDVLTDWSETVRPSMEKIFGANWHEKILTNGSKPVVVYVAAENTDNVNPPKEGKKNYGVPKFIGVYKDLDACREARDLRYPPRDEEAEMAFGPEDDDHLEDEDGSNGEITEELIKQVKDLYNSTRKNFKQTKKMLEGYPFGEEYEPADLLAAAGIKENK